MAKVVITADTETGDITAKVDGEAFENINYVSICAYEDMDEEPCVSVSLTLEPEKVSNLTKRVNISTANTNDGKEAIAQNKAEFITKDKHIIKYSDQSSLSESIA